MHGRACVDKKRGRSMLRAPSRATAFVEASGSSYATLSSPNSFFKDGRRIGTGDCALFKPSQHCAPFIGIIRSLTASEELKLGVNWLYRPAELRLGKGILLEAAPNEIFYSFHTDEIPAASLLHPCKVAFLPKGVELPSGISAFVCRRVYDIASKCLWWLTDRDYIDEHQGEVDQLLHRTRLEMHATGQPGGRSPKPMNGPTTAPQLKPSSESVQNIGSSFPSQVKGKKRERADLGSEPVKRECTSRFDDGDSVHGRPDNNLKSEISKFTDKGALVDSLGVEKLVQLMLPERNEEKIDLVSRSMLASVVAATDKFDCLSRFVQLRGLPVFDEWLQEVHKGKIGDCTNPKDGDKSVEEFLFVLLHALDKLPINLHALQMCNIGKSVNHLRSHKNIEIQRKARSLVDTWKKRVEAEMDARSGVNHGISWPARSRVPEASHGAIKTSVVHSLASKSTPAKLIQGENNAKTASPSTVSTKPSVASGSTNLKELQPKVTTISVSDVPSTAARDEKSSSSGQSHNNSLSYSSDHGKTVGVSGKESKNSSGSSRLRKSVNGFQGSASSTVQRETGSNRSSALQRSNNAAPEKLLQPSLTCEKAPIVPANESNSNKLIVKIPSRGRSPARSAGSLEDVAAMNSRVSSPVLLGKNDQVDHCLRGKSDTDRVNMSSDVNTESWHSNDLKDVPTGSDEGAGSPCGVPEEERCSTIDDTMKVPEIQAAASPPSFKELKKGKQCEGSLSSINALIESCVKYSEQNASMVIGDDVGMNLLASVAAGEISRSDMVSPTSSPQVNGSHIPQNHSKDGPSSENEKQHDISGTMWSEDAENNTISKPADDVGGILESSAKDLKHALNQCPESIGKSKDATMVLGDVCSLRSIGKTLDDDGNNELAEVKVDGDLMADHVSETKPKFDILLLTDPKVVDSGMKVESEATEKPFLNLVSELDCSVKKEQKPPCTISEYVRGMDEAPLLPSSEKKVDELKTEKADEMDATSAPTERQKTEGECGLDSSTTNSKAEHVGENLDNNEVKEHSSVGPPPSNVLSSLPVKETEQVGVEDADESTSVPGDASSVSAAAGSDIDSKLEFDLNEGFSGDDGRNGDLNNSTGPVTPTSAPVQLISPFPLPASITVAAAAKGPFVPPEDLLRNKGVHGWKGSAATSAFRPAEPRKAPEVLNNIFSALSDSSPGKQTRTPLDIDLNVPDDGVLEDVASRSSDHVTSSVSDPTGPVRSGLDLDLNRVDEPADISNNYTCNSSHRLEASFQPIKPSLGNHIPDKAGARRGFDLNNGPTGDDINSEQSMIFGQHARPTFPSQPPYSGIRGNGAADMGNFMSWFPGAANTFSPVSIPTSILPDRGDHQPLPIGGPQITSGSATTPSSFSPDLYRGPVLSASPAMPFPSSAQFQYPVFPFGTNFPLPLATFSAGSAMYVDSSSTGRLVFPPVSSQQAFAVPYNYPRPYVVSLTDVNRNSTSSESSRKWFKQDLDLNTGPETEGRSEAFSLVPRPLSASSSQSFTEEQVRMFHTSGGVLKRKEPDGRWDGYRPSSWQ